LCVQPDVEPQPFFADEEKQKADERVYHFSVVLPHQRIKVQVVVSLHKLIPKRVFVEAYRSDFNGMEHYSPSVAILRG